MADERDEPDQGWSLPWTARGRCERLQMRVTAPPILTIVGATLRSSRSEI